MNLTNSSFRLSKHAETRAQQRGVSAKTILAIIQHSDIQTRVGTGCVSLMISRRRLAQLPHEVLTPADQERAANVAVIVDPIDRVVISVMHAASRRGARYRRRFRTRARRPDGLARHISPIAAATQAETGRLPLKSQANRSAK